MYVPGQMASCLPFLTSVGPYSAAVIFSVTSWHRAQGLSLVLTCYGKQPVMCMRGCACCTKSLLSFTLVAHSVVGGGVLHASCKTLCS